MSDPLGASNPPFARAFAPVPLRPRRDGWTAEQQRRFVAALAANGRVARACASVGMSARSAYRLRARPDGAAFARAWDEAVAAAVPPPTAAPDLNALSTRALPGRFTRLRELPPAALPS